MPFSPSALSLVLALVSALVLAPPAARRTDEPQAPRQAPIAVRAAERGAPMVSFADGRALDEPFDGAADPLSMATGDFDSDGVPDLAVGYETGAGFTLAVFRGNVDAIYPNTPESAARKANGTFTNEPFMPGPRILALADRPSYLGAAHFDGDATVDLVVGTGSALDYLMGDGAGGFGAPERVELPGEITAFAVGEVNRRDLRDDVVVAVEGTEGARALVFQDPTGARGAEPESFALPARGSAIAIGPVDGRDWHGDVAIAAGDRILLVDGSDRTRVGERAFADTITSLALRRVAGEPHPRIVALTGAGELVELVDRSTPERRQGFARWRHEQIETGVAPGSRLVCAPATAYASEAVVVTDAAGRSLRVVAGDEGAAIAKTDAAFDVDAEPVAVLPMRLNVDAIADLVVLRRGQGAPSTILSTPRLNFIVSTAADSGMGSLRDAIIMANMNPGADSITFTNASPLVYQPGTPMPQITEAVTIDATTAPGYAGVPRFEIDGQNTSNNSFFVAAGASNCVIRGFAISRFVIAQVRVQGTNNFVETCRLGTDPNGTVALGGGSGVFCDNGGASNTIGGTTAAARNVISGLGGDGVLLQGLSSGSNIVRGNYIGTTANGLAALGNLNGVDLQSPSNTIGGIVANMTNVISANTNVGIAFQTATSASNVISGNTIGPGANQVAFIGNANAGVDLFSDAGDNFVGASGGSGGNLIRFNGTGIVATASPNNIVQGNTIDVNSGGGVVLASSGNQIGGSLTAANSIRNNGAAGIAVTGGVNNFLGRNSIWGNAGLAIDLGAAGVTPNDAGDGDGGPNNLQNFPVLTSAAVGVGSTRVDFTLNSTPNTTFQIDVYRNPACDGSGFGQAQVYVGAVTAMTDGSGTVFGFGIFPTIPAGESVSATATDPTGNTSELSACIVAENAADMSATISAAPNPVAAGQNLTFTVTIANGGPGSATNPVWSMNPVPNATFVSVLAPAGWSCMTPPVGGTGNVICNAPALAASANAVFSVVWMVDPATPENTAIPGDVSTSSDEPDINAVNNNDIAVALTTVDADMAITISDSPDPVVAGTDVVYLVTVTNNGPSPATNASWSMTFPPNTTFNGANTPPGWLNQLPPGGIAFVATSVAPGASANFTFNLTVGDDTPDGTVLTASPTVTSDANDSVPGNNQASTTTTVSAEADLAVTLADAPDPVVAGTDLAYAIQVANGGPSDAQSAALSFTTPPGTTFVAAAPPPGWSCTAPAVGGTGTVSCTTPTLVAGGMAAFSVTVHVTPTVAGGTTIMASATASSAATDSTPGNDTGVAMTTVGSVADLGVTMDGTPGPVLPTDEITYTVTVSNAGPSDAANATLADPVPENTDFVSVSPPAGWSCTDPDPLGDGVITCTTPSLPAGTSAVFTIVVRVNLTASPDAPISNTAIVSSASADPDATNNSASASTLVGQTPAADVALAKTASPANVAPGGAITYTVTATNNGPTAAIDLVISDPLPAGVTFISVSPSADGILTAPAPGATGTVSCLWSGPTAAGESRAVTIVVQAATSLEDGTLISNTATVDNAVTDSDPTNDAASANSIVVVDANTPQSDLSVSLVDPPETVETGTRLEYAILIENNGPDTATGVTLSGSTPNATRFLELSADRGTVTAPAVGSTGLFSLAIDELDAGESVAVTLAVNVVGEGDTNVANRLTVTSETNDPQPFNNQTSAITRVLAGLDTEIRWDPPLPCDDDCLNPPLHLQSFTIRSKQEAAVAGQLASLVRDTRNTVIGYNIYRSNDPNVAATPANFFTSVPPNVTSIVVPTAPSGSFFTVTATYPNGESEDTNAASGGIPEPQITGFEIRGNQVLVFGTGFTDTVQVFVDGIPFKRAAKLKDRNGSIRIVQKGKLITGQSVNAYLTGQGNVILVSVLNSDTGIGTFLYRR